MFILAFSLDWFTTIPGILISLGVVLLIIALILFIVGIKKTSKEKKIADAQSDIYVEEDSINQEVTPIADVNANPVEVKSGIAEEPKFEEISVGTPGIDPINPIVDETNGTNEVSINENKEEENISNLADSTVNLDNTIVSVYGEEKVEENVNEEPKVTIYGGNDPLEATQNLPKVDEHHEPYGGAISEVKIVDATDDEIVQIPEVEPIKIETPTIEEEVVSIEIPSEPVVIPSEPTEIPSVVSESSTDTSLEEEKPVVEEL